MSAVDLAVAALLVSGLTLGWTVYWSVYTHRRATQPQMVVRQSLGIYGRQVGVRALIINATNDGPAVTLSGFQVAIRHAGGQTAVPRQWIAQAPRPLPIRLERGDTWTGIVDAAFIKEDLDQHFGQRQHWHVRAVMSDAANRTYKGRAKGWWSRLLPGRKWVKVW